MVLVTTVVGSYPQPDWLVDREMLGSRLPPRVRAREIWRVPGEWLAQAQEDATVVAIRDMERAGIDILTDGEIRRESYSNRFATALPDKDVILGVVDLNDPSVEPPEIIAARIRAALEYHPAERLQIAPDCGMKYLPREVAFAKLQAMTEAAATVRAELSR
ncbi:hypothetical protein [Acrocarpospora catenulata]|uniref:hypothetical protein n=1 Tax=Acrocarpospora catenulata TaxID=2836182 RepID=UPI001BD93990|nr:hypothetical protein [Acrocarpospora catenulata]